MHLLSSVHISKALHLHSIVISLAKTLTMLESVMIGHKALTIRFLRKLEATASRAPCGRQQLIPQGSWLHAPHKTELLQSAQVCKHLPFTHSGVLCCSTSDYGHMQLLDCQCLINKQATHAAHSKLTRHVRIMSSSNDGTDNAVCVSCMHCYCA